MELFNNEKYDISKFDDLLEMKCDICECVYSTTKRNVYRSRKYGYMNHVCGRKCNHEASMRTKGYKRPENVECRNCCKKFSKRCKDIKKSENHFCSISCAATYNNTHKTKGNRRSKLEKWLEEQIAILYPDLEILYSDKTTINSELDIYIPSLNLAFELNGIFHYEPIFGESKLEQIQNNDHRKFQACLEKGIELCIIDTSLQKYFKESTSQKYLDIITTLVNMKLSKTDYVEVL